MTDTDPTSVQRMFCDANGYQRPGAAGVASAVPPGWKLVPAEPTPEWVAAIEPMDAYQGVATDNIRVVLNMAPAYGVAPRKRRRKKRNDPRPIGEDRMTLSDKQIADIADFHNTGRAGGDYDFARAIEAATLAASPVPALAPAQEGDRALLEQALEATKELLRVTTAADSKQENKLPSVTEYKAARQKASELVAAIRQRLKEAQQDGAGVQEVAGVEVLADGKPLPQGEWERFGIERADLLDARSGTVTSFERLGRRIRIQALRGVKGPEHG